MPDLTQSVPAGFIIETIGAIFAVIALGVVAVQRAKKQKENA